MQSSPRQGTSEGAVKLEADGDRTSRLLVGARERGRLVNYKLSADLSFMNEYMLAPGQSPNQRGPGMCSAPSMTIVAHEDPAPKPDRGGPDPEDDFNERGSPRDLDLGLGHVNGDSLQSTMDSSMEIENHSRLFALPPERKDIEAEHAGSRGDVTMTDKVPPGEHLATLNGDEVPSGVLQEGAPKRLPEKPDRLSVIDELVEKRIHRERRDMLHSHTSDEKMCDSEQRPSLSCCASPQEHDYGTNKGATSSTSSCSASTLKRRSGSAPHQTESDELQKLGVVQPAAEPQCEEGQNKMRAVGDQLSSRGKTTSSTSTATGPTDQERDHDDADDDTSTPVAPEKGKTPLSTFVKEVPGKGRCLFSRTAHQAGTAVFTEVPTLVATESRHRELWKALEGVHAEKPFLLGSWSFHFAAILTVLALDDERIGIILDKFVPEGERSDPQILYDMTRILQKVDLERMGRLLHPELTAAERERLNSSSVRDATLLTALAGSWRYNSFGHHSEEGLVLYNRISMCAHSCEPNCCWTYGEAEAFVLRARRNLAEGDEITISYLQDEDLVKSTDIRRKRCENWKFTCNCERCAMHVDVNRGFRCLLCRTGSHNVIYGPDGKPGLLPCSVCGETTDEAAQILKLEPDYVSRIQSLDTSNMADCEIVYNAALDFFHDSHWCLYYIENFLYDALKKSDVEVALPHLRKKVDYQSYYYARPTFLWAWAIEELADKTIQAHVQAAGIKKALPDLCSATAKVLEQTAHVLPSRANECFSAARGETDRLSGDEQQVTECTGAMPYQHDILPRSHGSDKHWAMQTDGEQPPSGAPPTAAALENTRVEAMTAVRKGRVALVPCRVTKLDERVKDAQLSQRQLLSALPPATLLECAGWYRKAFHMLAILCGGDHNFVRTAYSKAELLSRTFSAKHSLPMGGA